MRDLIKQIVQGFSSLKLEGQHDGYIQLSARDPDTKQPVSIKIVPKLLSKDAQTAARFRTLSQTIRQLNHPGIAPIRRVGEQSGLSYLIAQAVEAGRFLAAQLDKPWTVDSASDLVIQVGRALEHAYNKGLVHGALTPSTIAVQDNGHALVTDFGLAQLQDLAGLTGQPDISPFLAPEREAGGPASPRADVYSLAAILYTLLARRPPMIVQGQVLPPGRFNTDVPAAMDAAVVKGLALDPTERYPNVKSFVAALGAVALAPTVKPAKPQPSGMRCSRCGAEGQSGRFCRKCGAPLPATRPAERTAQSRSRASEPIQVTKVTVGEITIGPGVTVHPTTISEPIAVTSGELAAQFPPPVEMPHLEAFGLGAAAGDQPMLAMPEPPPMPEIDWTGIGALQDSGLAMPKASKIEDLLPEAEQHQEPPAEERDEPPR